VSLFKSPAGRSFEGTGLAPEIEVGMEDRDVSRAISAKPEDRLAMDVQLRTARELLLRK
jgi:C-terminal processing protease CtpA/Prc